MEIWLSICSLHSLTQNNMLKPKRCIDTHYLTLNTQAANADYYFGILALVQGRYEEAILNLQRAIKDAPNDADAHLYLAQALEKVGKPQEAMHAYRRVLSLDPHNKIANDRVKANETMP